MTTTIRLEPELESRLDRLAKMTGRTKTYYIREALIQKLEDMEDTYIAEHRLENKAGKTWTLDEIRRGDDINN